MANLSDTRPDSVETNLTSGTSAASDMSFCSPATMEEFDLEPASWCLNVTQMETAVKYDEDLRTVEVMLKKDLKVCNVCSVSSEQVALYFGQRVCVPCKTFFLRYEGHPPPRSKCRNVTNIGSCRITPTTRTRCQFCRFKKCKQIGMLRKVRDELVLPIDGRRLCRVCNDEANGIHFGVETCEGCKKFFRRAMSEHGTYQCKNGDSGARCVINPRTRNSCRFCRYEKCTKVGMSRDAIQMGRPSKMRTDKDASRVYGNTQQLVVTQPIQMSEQMQVQQMQQVQQIQHVQQMQQMQHMQHMQQMQQIYPHQDEHYFNNEFQFYNQVPYEVLHNSSLESSSYQSYPPNSASGAVAPPTSTAYAGFDFYGHRKLPALNGAANFSEYKPSPDMNTSMNLPQMEVKTNDGIGMDQDHFFDERLDCSPFVHNNFTDPAQTQHLPHENSFKPSSLTPNVNCYNPAMLAARFQVENPPELPAHQPSMQPPALDPNCPIKLEHQMTSMAIREDERIFEERYPTKKMNVGTKIKKVDNFIDNRVRSGETASSRQTILNLSSGELDEILTYIERLVTSDGTVVEEGNNGAPSKDDSRVPTRPDKILSPFNGVTIPYILDGVQNTLRRYEDGQHCSMPDGRICGHTLKCLKEHSIKYWKNFSDSIGQCDSISDKFGLIKLMYDPYQYFNAQSQNTNKMLRWEFERDATFSIRDNVAQFYTSHSITMCEKLPGFDTLKLADQQTIVRLGQSPSRILIACLEWYNPETHSFGDFLCWRNEATDTFKMALLGLAAKIAELRLDPIEASILNYLLLIGTDYPILEEPAKIESYRNRAVDLLMAYYFSFNVFKGTEQLKRIARLFGLMPTVKLLGNIHFLMTYTKSMKFEDCMSMLSVNCGCDAGATAEAPRQATLIV